MRQYDRGTESDPVIRAAGGCIVSAGPADRRASPDEIFAAINEQTAAIILVEFDSTGQADAAAAEKRSMVRNPPVLYSADPGSSKHASSTLPPTCGLAGE